MVSRNAMITIAGRPNVGKSTLANTLAGEKVAIVTSKPQTTRNRIFAVVNRGDTQFVFVDTPGFHKARNKLGDYMVRVVNDSVTDVDAVCLVVEPTAAVGTQETLLLEKLAESDAPVVLVINKIDTVKKEDLLAVMDVYSKAFSFADIVPISARTGENVEELLKVLETYAQEGPQLFPEGMVTCDLCPFCHTENSGTRFRCTESGEILPFHNKGTGARCPLDLPNNEKESEEFEND